MFAGSVQAVSAGARRRGPVVAGYFYPESADALRHAIDAYDAPAGVRHSARAIILPHGSLEQCGAVAAAACRDVRVPSRCVVIAPAHTDSALRWSLISGGSFATPLGEVDIDYGFASALRRRCALLEEDSWGQRGEHGIEVVLPWLQTGRPEGFTLVPLMTRSEDLEECVRVGRDLAELSAGEDETLLIASANLSHYEPVARAAVKDRRLIEAIGTGDPLSLARALKETETVMCGFGAVACAMAAAGALGATEITLARYGTSVHAGGDPESVVGYAGIVMR